MVQRTTYKEWAEEIMFFLLQKNCWDITQLATKDSLRPTNKDKRKEEERD
jgi:hypothetical protein